MDVALGVAGPRGHIAGDGLEEVEVLDVRGTYDLLQAYELGDRGHLAAFHLHEDVLQRLRVESVFGRCCGHDAIDLAILIEVADVCAAAVCSERVEHIGGRHASPVALGRIDVHLILREALRVGGHGGAYLRTLRQFGHELLCMTGELGEVAVGGVFHDEVNVVARAVAGNLRHNEGGDNQLLDVLTVLDEALAHEGNIVLETLALVPVLQAHDHGGVVRAGARQHGVAAAHGIALQLGNLLHLLLHFLHHLAGLLQRGALGGMNLYEEHTLVLDGHEA